MSCLQTPLDWRMLAATESEGRMSVSHTFVSWIQVIGLIVGLYGFFFVSVSIFGDKNARWFSALLPASGMGVGLLVWMSGMSVSPIIYVPAALLVFVTFYVAAAHIRMENMVIDDKDDPSGLMRKLSKLLFVTTVTITIPTLVLLVWAGIAPSNHVSASQAASDSAILRILAGGVMILWGVILIYSLPKSLESPQLLKLGFVLSVLAVLTQFIPPVLDLLNIPVK